MIPFVHFLLLFVGRDNHYARRSIMRIDLRSQLGADSFMRKDKGRESAIPATIPQQRFRSHSSCCFDIRLFKVIALEQQALAGQYGERVGETVTVV